MLPKKLVTMLATFLMAAVGSAQGVGDAARKAKPTTVAPAPAKVAPAAVAPAEPSATAKADEIVQTRDGRSVVLKANGTWTYVASAGVASTAAAATGTLALETGIVYMMGGAQPVARQQFRLLRKSLKDIYNETLNDPEVQAAIAKENAEKAAKEKKKKPAETAAAPEAITDESAATKYLFHRVLASLVGVSAEGKAIEAAIERATAAALTTGFDGKGTFEPVPVGPYFVVGFTELRGNKHGVWCMPVQVKAGASTIVLDQGNFASSF